MAGHSLLSPSGASRWLACPPSARFEQQYPDSSSVYADEGTIAHEVAGLILSVRAGMFRANFPAVLSEIEHRAGLFYKAQGKPSGFAAMVEHAEEYAAFVLEQAQGTLYIEKTYSLEPHVPGGRGTADCTNVTKDTLYIVDYKYGSGVAVTATANPQLMLYALGALPLAPNATKVVLSIFQPRAGGASTWSISTAELYTWARTEVMPKARLAIAGLGEFAAGDHCKFCKVKTSCKAFYDRFAETKGLKDARLMSSEQLSQVLEFGSTLTSWIESVKEDATKKLLAGETVEGWKLVAGRGQRVFTNENDVVEILLSEGLDSDEIYTSKLKGITAIEEQVGKKNFERLLGGVVVKQPGKPTLAKDIDKRPSLKESAADEYDD